MDATAFLCQYGFDLGGRSPQDWLAEWKRSFPQSWVASALVEALYRGRYKAVSVQQLLVMWQSRGTPCMGFGLDFGRKVWPDGVDRLQSGLEQGSATTAPLRSYAFESFELTELSSTGKDSPAKAYRSATSLGSQPEPTPKIYLSSERNPTITMSPLRRQLRWESIPTKLHDILAVV
ncbi:MAG: hypothetical protein AB4050_20185 [Synechococcus sp.]